MHGPGSYTKAGFAVPGESDAFSYDESAAQWLADRLAHREMSMSIFKEAVDQTHGEGAEDFNLCGLGEPTLNRSYPEMIEYIRRKGARVSLDTNGSRLLKPRQIERLISLGLHGLHVSVNAATSEVYRKVNGTRIALSDIQDALTRLSRAKTRSRSDIPHVLVSMVVTRDNFHEVEPFVAFADAVGARQVVFDHMVPGRLTAADVPSGPERERTLDAIEVAREMGANRGLSVVSNYSRIDSQQQYSIPCIVGYLFTRIMADGTVAGCCGCSHSLGKLPEEGFRSIWYGQAYRAFRAEEEMIHVTRIPVTHCLCGSCPHVETNYEYVARCQWDE